MIRDALQINTKIPVDRSQPFHEWLRDTIEAAGYKNPYEFSIKARIDYSCLSKILNHEAIPSHPTARKIATYLNVNIYILEDWLHEMRMRRS